MPGVDEVRGVLSYPTFRRLWIALSLSSLGDWLGLLAMISLARELSDGGVRESSFAIGGVLIFRLLPAVLLGPVSGVFADRFDRRRTMVVCDILRFSVFVSIPFVVKLDYGYAYLPIASFLVEAIGLFWIPAKDASVPNLLPRQKLEAANQVSLITTYGSAPVAAAVFALLSKTSDALGAAVPFFKANPVDLAIWFNASTFLFSAFTVWRLTEISRTEATRTRRSPDGAKRSFLGDLTAGWRFIGGTPLIRGLVFGMLGAFAAGGAVIALGRQFVGLLGGGEAAFGLLFGAVFSGLAFGMGFGPRLLHDFSRRRLFGLAITGAGLSLAVMALLPNLILALFATVSVGGFAGIGWVTGQTLLGAEVEDELRGRTFAAVQSLVRVDLLLTLAAVPFIAGVIGDHAIGVGRANVRFDGITLTLFVAGVIASLVGLVAYRQMDDGELPLWREFLVNTRFGRRWRRHHHPGAFIVFEGGEGAGKSTQVRLLAEWLADRGLEVVASHEPGATPVGEQIRAVLLDRANTALDPRAEALLYAADRAHHVGGVIRPALARGAVVISDRYVDSSLAYQGGGRELSPDSVRKMSEWATGGLVPDLTIVLDIDPERGLTRITGEADRIEAESLDFHSRVRDVFVALAGRDPHRYSVIDASLPATSVHTLVRREVERRLGHVLTELQTRTPVATPL